MGSQVSPNTYFVEIIHALQNQSLFLKTNIFSKARNLIFKYEIPFVLLHVQICNIMFQEWEWQMFFLLFV